MKQYIELHAQKLYIEYYKTAGATETLVFLHDAWGCVAMWGDTPHILSEKLKANILLYDRCGHGKSSAVYYERRSVSFFHDEAKMLIDLLDAFQISKASLFGFSDGGTISLVAASLYPERINRLILQSPHTCVELEGLALVAQITEQAKHNHLLESLRAYHGENTEMMFQHWSRMWSDERFQAWSIIPEIQKITCSIIAFRGENDHFDTVKQNTTIAEHAHGIVKLALIPDAQHNSCKENQSVAIDFIVSTWQSL